jgi:phosphoglycerol transferase
MKVAVQHAFPNSYPLVAETELIERFIIALHNLGWQVAKVVTSDDIMRFRPDFVLTTHYSSPKLTGVPTLGLMTNPPEYFRDGPDHIRNILSYDGYLAGSPRISEYLSDLTFPTGKKVPITDFPFLLSTHETEFVERPPAPYRLFYVGTRLDPRRHESLFERLSKVVPLDVYGPPNHWAGIDCSHKGGIRADGRSLLVKLRESGAALCIHTKEHRAWELPTMRVFEAAASGAVILADEIPFVREHFGDVILPVDADQPIERVVEQVSEHVAWINDHPRQAAEMARQAHAIFCGKFSLERMFERLPAFLEEVRQAGGYQEQGRKLAAQATGQTKEANGCGQARRYRYLPKDPTPSSTGVLTATAAILDGKDSESLCGLAGPSLEYIICIDDAPASQIDCCLRSLAQQSYRDIGIIVVRSADVAEDEILKKHRSSFASLKVLTVARSSVRSNALWAGLREVTAPFFAHLEPDHRLHLNHVACLMDTLEENRGLDMALASSIEVQNDDGPYFHQWNFNGPLGQQIPETRRLAGLGIMKAEQLIESADIVSNCSWIARRELLDQAVLEDPELTGAEAVYLCALLLAKSRGAANNWRPTCEWHVGARVGDRKDSGDGQARCLDRVRCRLGLEKRQKTPDPKQELEELLHGSQQELGRQIQAVQEEFGRQVQSVQKRHDAQAESVQYQFASQAQVFQDRLESLAHMIDLGLENQLRTPLLELTAHVQRLEQLVGGQAQILHQKLDAHVQILNQRLDEQVHHATSPESHALRKLSHGYLTLRGSWKVLTRPHRIPGRCWRGLLVLARRGPRDFLARLSQVGQSS